MIRVDVPSRQDGVHVLIIDLHSFVSQMQDEYGVKELMSLVTDDPNFLNEYTLNSFLRHHVEFIHRFRFYTCTLFQEVTTS